MRRIITGHNDNGKSVISIDGPPARSIGEEAGGLYEIWNTDGSGFDTTSNELGLATYPSVALWNPYDVGIGCREYYIEIPIQIGMEAMNAKHYDLYRKWWMYCFDNQNYLLNDGNDPSVPPFNIPKGFKNFEDRNGNGKRDAGEP